MKKVLLVIGVLIALAAIAFDIWAVVTYGNKPASEVPAWALWLLTK